MGTAVPPVCVCGTALLFCTTGFFHSPPMPKECGESCKPDIGCARSDGLCRHVSHAKNALIITAALSVSNKDEKLFLFVSPGSCMHHKEGAGQADDRQGNNECLPLEGI